MKKKLASILLSILFVLSFVGCGKESPIPSGFYCETNYVDEMIYCEFCCTSDRKSHVQAHCWEIDGMYVRCWVSSAEHWRAKIVEKDGKIYFEGYKWTSRFLSTKKSGNKDIYQVIYDEQTKSFTLTLVEKSKNS